MNITIIYDKYESHFLEPLGLLLISNICKKLNHKVTFVHEDLKTIKRHLHTHKTDILMWTTHTGDHTRHQQWAQQILTEIPTITQIFGGSHITFSPDYVKQPGIDIGIMGEADQSLPILLKKIERKEDITTSPNVITYKNGILHKNDIMPLTQNLDKLPFFDRHATPIIQNKKLKSHITSRGCLFNCTYCFEHTMKKMVKNKGLYLRRQTPKRVIKELKYMKENTPTQYLFFHDSIFIYADNWFKDFAPLYKKHIGLPYSINQRLEFINPQTAQLLKDSGCESITMAYETANDRIRLNLLKRYMKKPEMIKAVQELKKRGIYVVLQNMLGLPTETLKNSLETLDLNMKAKPNYAWVSMFHPFENTELGQYSKDNDLIKPSTGQENFHTNTIMKLPNEREQVNLQKLFAITNHYQFIRPILPILIKLPLTKLYDKLRLIHKGFTYKQYSTKKYHHQKDSNKDTNT